MIGADETPLAEGHLIGDKYRVVRRIGAGGMGAVYEATNSWTGRHVAIKVLLARLATSSEVTRRFAQEAQVSAQLNHPNIVDVFDMGRAHDGGLFIVQEYLDGQPLSSLVGNNKRITPRQAIEILLPVLDALGFAHARGVVHRDLKPGNIFLARDAQGRVAPKVIDFGIAKLLDERVAADLTNSGVIIGTPGYLAPEQASGESVPIDQRADLWALGAVLYVMLAGRGPFVASTPPLVLVQVLTQTAPDVRTFAPDAPADLAAVLKRALAFDREARFSSAAEFSRALLSCEAARGLVDPSRAPSLSSLTPQSLTPQASSPTEMLSASRGSRSRLRWLLVPGAVVSLATIVALAASFSGVLTPAPPATPTSAAAPAPTPAAASLTAAHPAPTSRAPTVAPPAPVAIAPRPSQGALVDAGVVASRDAGRRGHHRVRTYDPGGVPMGMGQMQGMPAMTSEPAVGNHGAAIIN